jgi:hypothetical protein
MSLSSRNLVFILLLFYGVNSHAREPLQDSTNFIAYFDKILIKANVSSQTDQYVLRDKAKEDFKLRANNEFKLFLSLDYEFVGFSYGFSPKLFNENDDDDLKGHTSFTDYKLQFFPGQWLQTISYDKTRGYYVENTGDYIPGWSKNKDPYLQLFNLKNEQWAMSTSYVCSPDFSFKNLIYQTQWQKKSAGSFVPSLYYDYNRYSFDFAGIQALQKDFNLRLGLGYYYTLIIADRIYLSPDIIPSIGLRYSKFSSTENGNTTVGNKVYVTRFLEGGVKLGYNTDRWVAGGGFNFNINWYNEGPTSIVENNKFYGILYIGYRFTTPGFITKAYKKLSEKLP